MLDDDFTWVDCNGRILDKQQAANALPKPPLGDERGLEPVGQHYGEVVSIAVDRDKMFVLRIWVQRAAGWRLLAYHEVSQNLPAAPHGPGRKEWDNPCLTLPYEPRNADERDCLASWQRLEIAVMRHEPDEFGRSTWPTNSWWSAPRAAIPKPTARRCSRSSGAQAPIPPRPRWCRRGCSALKMRS